MEAGFNVGSCRAEPELFRLRSLLLSAARGPGLSDDEVVAEAVVAMLGEEFVGWARKGGRRLGGLAVETVGLKETLRETLRVGTGCDELGSRGEVSEASWRADIVNAGGRIEWVLLLLPSILVGHES